VTLQSARAVHRPVTPTASQKYVLLAPPSATARPASVQSLASSTPAAGNQLMRTMTPTSSTTAAAAAAAAATTTKLVVVTVDSVTDSLVTTSSGTLE